MTFMGMISTFRVIRKNELNTQISCGKNRTKLLEVIPFEPEWNSLTVVFNIETGREFYI